MVPPGTGPAWVNSSTSSAMAGCGCRCLSDGPVTDGDALKLPTVRYLDAEFIPAFTSAGQLNEVLGRRGPDMAGRAGADPSRAPAVLGAQVPHAVVAAAELARLLPAGLGIALNPGAAVSVPIYPEDVAYLGERRRRDRRLSDPRRPSAGGTHAAAQRHRGWACAVRGPPSRPPGRG